MVNGAQRRDVRDQLEGRVLLHPAGSKEHERRREDHLDCKRLGSAGDRHPAHDAQVTSLLGAFTGLYSSYQGSKAPVEWFTKAAAKELQPRGIKVNA